MDKYSVKLMKRARRDLDGIYTHIVEYGHKSSLFCVNRLLFVCPKGVKTLYRLVIAEKG